MKLKRNITVLFVFMSMFLGFLVVAQYSTAARPGVGYKIHGYARFYSSPAGYCNVKIYAGDISPGNYVGSTTANSNGYFDFTYYCPEDPGVFSVYLTYYYLYNVYHGQKTIYGSGTNYYFGYVYVS